MEEPPLVDPGRRHHQGRLSMKRWIDLRKAKTEGKHWLARAGDRENGKRPGSKTCGSNTIRSSAIIWKSPIPIKIMVPDYYITKADPDQCGALYHAGAERAGGYDSGCGGQAVLPWNMTCSADVGITIADRGADGSRRQPRRWQRSGCVCFPGFCGGTEMIMSARR